jgi:hypothetical protein
MVWATYVLKYYGVRQTGGDIVYEGDTYIIEKSNLGASLNIKKRWSTSIEYLFIWDGSSVDLCHLGPWVIALDEKVRTIKRVRFTDL